MTTYKTLSPEAMTMKALSGELEFAREIARYCRRLMKEEETVAVFDADGNILIEIDGYLRRNVAALSIDDNFITVKELSVMSKRSRHSMFRREISELSDDRWFVDSRLQDNGDLIITLIPRS